MLLHNGSTHEGFENLVEPWTNRTPVASCPPPHAWAAAKTALFIRNMMVREYGGNLDIDRGQRDLHLYSLISPSWAWPGQHLEIKNAATEMGTLSSRLSFGASGAELKVNADFHYAPRYVTLRIPYFVRMNTFESDADTAFEKDNVLYFSPDITHATLRWTEIPNVHEDTYQDILKAYRSEFDFIVKDGDYDPERASTPFLLADEEVVPPEPLSFDLVRRAFLKEYTRRYTEYRHAGGIPYPVTPPRLLSADERKVEYRKQGRTKDGASD